MQSERRALSQKTDDFCMPFPSRGLRKLAGLPDHLVRLEEERRGDREAEGLGGLQVDDKLELHGLLHGQVRRLRPSQELVDVGRGALEPIEVRRTVSHET